MRLVKKTKETACESYRKNETNIVKIDFDLNTAIINFCWNDDLD